MKKKADWNIFLVVVLLWGMAFFSHADETNPPRSTVYKTDEIIKIDGIPDETAWEKAAPSPIFLEITEGTAPLYPVTAKLLWDDKYLYMSFKISDPDVWSINVLRDFPMAGKYLPGAFLLKERDLKDVHPYTENFIKIYIDPDSDGMNYTEIHVSPRNTICDKWQETPWSKDVSERMGIKYPEDGVKIHPEWNCPGMKTAVHIDGTINDPYDVDKGWTVEVAIPFSSLKHLTNSQNFPPRTGDTWKLHLGRRYVPYYGAEPSYWTWPVIGEKDCHVPDRWGTIVFADHNTSISQNAEAMPVLNMPSKKDPVDFASLPKGVFKWKAIWARTIKTHGEADELIGLAKAMKCNVIIVSTITTTGGATYESKFLPHEKSIEPCTLKYLISKAHGNDMKVHSWFVNLRATMELAKEHPEFLQKVRDWEEENARLPRVDLGRANVHTGNWLCPDRGLIEYEKNVIGEIVREFDFDGFAFDYVGYRNYYACFCAYSLQKRQEFADKHPDLPASEVMHQFSEDCLVNYVTECREFVKTLKPDMEFSIHIYPDFDLNPVYGNRLPVDYCGQTIAWFYKPFWSYGKIYDTCMKYKEAEGKFVKYNKFVPFVGVYEGENLKTPERFRTEIRIAGLADNGTIMFAFNEAFKKHPELVKIVAEELSNDKNGK